MNKPLLFVGSTAIVFAIAIFGYSALQRKPAEDTMLTGQSIVDVIVPTLDGDAATGETVFVQYCSACHGKNAAGKNGIAPPLVHKIYEPSHHADSSFVRAALNGATAHHWPFGDMPPVKGITEPEINLVISYVRALQRANGIQ